MDVELTTDGDRNERHDPSPGPGDTVRLECIEAAGPFVAETDQLPPGPHCRYSVLNGCAAVSPEVVLAFEREGGSNADFWKCRQTANDLAQAHRRPIVA